MRGLYWPGSISTFTLLVSWANGDVSERNELAGEIKSYKDLNDPKYKVVSKLGTTGEQAVKRMIPKAKYVSFETEQEGVMEVVNGKADAFVYDLPYCAAAIAQKGEGKLVFLDQPFTYEPLGWAVRKGDYDFLNWLNNFLRQSKGDGFYDRVYQKWIIGSDWKKDHAAFWEDFDSTFQIGRGIQERLKQDPNIMNKF